MSSPDAETPWNNSHRAFLQAILTHQTLTYQTGAALLSAIQTAATPDRPTATGDITLEDFTNTIAQLNEQLTTLDFEIRATTHQQSKEQVWCLINTSGDGIAQLATGFGAEELAFVKRVLDLMFERYNTRAAEVMAVTSMQALKVARPRESLGAGRTQAAVATNGVTIREAERVLEGLREEGWLELSEAGFFSLSPRALMELRGWLVETYNGVEVDEEGEEEEVVKRIRHCKACGNIVTVGQRCPDLDCEGRLHVGANGCAGKVWRAQNGRQKCPVCDRDWVNPLPVGEEAARGRRNTGGD
ncbi:hypothetical protein MBLNU230_g8205t1 [Neophaeotheca triangularis]